MFKCSVFKFLSLMCMNYVKTGKKVVSLSKERKKCIHTHTPHYTDKIQREHWII